MKKQEKNYLKSLRMEIYRFLVKNAHVLTSVLLKLFVGGEKSSQHISVYAFIQFVFSLVLIEFSFYNSLIAQNNTVYIIFSSKLKICDIIIMKSELIFSELFIL